MRTKGDQRLTEQEVTFVGEMFLLKTHFWIRMDELKIPVSCSRNAQRVITPKPSASEPLSPTRVRGEL